MPSKGRIGEIIEVRRSAQELSLEWPIPNFLSLPCGHGDWYKSPRFSFWDGCWNLRVWPKWYSEWVKFGLSREDSGTSVKTVNVAFGVKGSNGVEKSRENEWMFSNNGTQCFSFYFKRSEISRQKQRLMPNDVFTITCDMKTHSTVRDPTRETDDSLKEPNTNGKQAPGKKDDPIHEEEVKVLTEERPASEKQALEDLQSSLKNLLISEKDCDVTIKVQGKEFKAHRLILQARSPVFQAMFSHDMVERQRGMVTMEDCDAESFPAFLEHIYSGSIRMISAKNVFSLFSACDKYDFPTLKNECSEFMKKNMTVACFCDAITLAIKHNEKDLIEHATEFFCRNSLNIVKTAEWQIFLKENTTVGNELFIKQLSNHENCFSSAR